MAGLRRRVPPAELRPRLSRAKVPEATAYFWITKILTTGMGEATSDFLVHRINPVIAVGLGGTGLLIALVLQFSVRRYITWVYWLAVVMVAVFGTMIADVFHVGLGIPYAVSTVVFAICLAVVFAAWRTVEGTLSIHSIHTVRREAFYWAAVMATFALGTAAGDLTAATMGLGFFSSGLAFTALIAVPALAWRGLGLNPVAAFWSAYVVTRPLGASFADWIGVPASVGGLGWGRGTTSLASSVIIAVLVAYLTVTGSDRPGRHRGRQTRHNHRGPAW